MTSNLTSQISDLYLICLEISNYVVKSQLGDEIWINLDDSQLTFWCNYRGSCY